VIAIDTNILVYGHRLDSPFHGPAFGVLKKMVEGHQSWAIPWPCLHEFLAKVTHPRIFKTPTPLDRALDQVREWLRSPSVRVLSEPDGYMDSLSVALLDSKVAGAKIHDGRIVAICLAHGMEELWSADRDFNRFSGLRVTNPLTGPEKC
jgi:toxin-antitoxin system PIN domain toxin